MASPQPSAGTFVTGVDAGGAASPAGKRSPSPARHSTVRRVEDEDFVFTPGAEPQPLPSLVNYRIVIDDILDTVVDVEDHQSE